MSGVISNTNTSHSEKQRNWVYFLQVTLGMVCSSLVIIVIIMIIVIIARPLAIAASGPIGMKH